MKRIILTLIAVVCFCPMALAVERTTVTKDSSGTMSHVSAYVTEGGVTVFQVMADGSVSVYATTYNNWPTPASTPEQGVTGTGTPGQIAYFTGAGTGTTQIAGVDSLSGTSVVGGSLTTTSIKTTEVVYGGTSTWYVYSGTTLTGTMLAGGMIYVFTPPSGVTPTVIGIPAFTGSSGFFFVKDMTGCGVTVQTADSMTMYNDDEVGTAYWVNAGHSRHAASFKLNQESGSCRFVDVLGEVGNYWLMN